MNQILGIDVGATGIKGAIVDLKKGILITERFKLSTPQSGEPVEMIEVIDQVVNHFDWRKKPIGVGFPAIIKNDRAWSASNISDSWIGFKIKKEIEAKTKCPCEIVNDADAAGLAELNFGNGKNIKGTMILLTLGTGIGSAIFNDGVLLPNTELGHLKYKDGVLENYAANSARKRKDLSWEEYGIELNEVLNHINFIFSPNLTLLGGGISKKYQNFSEYLSKDLNILPAAKFNNAGIIGAALAYNR